jgi:hypothetical protein
MLSVPAFDAAIELAQSRKLLLSEALSMQKQAVAGRNSAGDGGLHWDEETGSALRYMALDKRTKEERESERVASTVSRPSS